VTGSSVGDSVLPLDGIRITGLCSGKTQSALFAIDILRDLGASIRVFPKVNSDINEALDACEDSDVLIVDDDARRVLGAIGLEPSKVEDRFPQLVVGYFSPFGLTGPWSNLMGSEIVAEAAAAVMLSNGEEGDPPLPTGVPVAALGGALLGTVAILAALHDRESSAVGQSIDQSEYDSVFAFSGTLLPSVFLTGRPLKRLGNHHAMASPWNVYPTRDAWLVLCTMNDAQFATLARAIERPDLLDDDRYTSTTSRVANAATLDDFIGEWSATMQAEEASKYLQSKGLSAEAVKSVAEVIQDPQTKFRELVQMDKGETVAGPFLRFSQAGAVHNSTEDGTGRTVELKSHIGNGGPLNGVRVLEFAAHTAGPLAGRLLSLLGADVVKVESPKGESARYIAQQIEGSSYLFLINNTDKWGCTLDLQSDIGHLKMDEITRNSDIFITNLVPSTLATLGLSPSELLSLNPQLMYCGITGFGEGGPYGERRIFDSSVQAMTGIMELTGRPVDEPRKSAISIIDVFGACSAAIGALAGLLSRDRGRKGCIVEASLYDIAVWSTQNEWTTQRSNDSKQESGALDTCFPTSDGFLAVTSDRETLLELAGRMILREPAGLRSSMDLCINAVRHGDDVAQLMKLFSSATWESECWSSGIAAFVPRRLDEAATAEHTRARELLVDVEFKGHEVRVIGSPFKFSRSKAQVRRAAPWLGQDNERLLGEMPSLHQ
jgi:crotonobetainyl-CoA:carnitine CoA-transferase CaiB-like acyl-CoA transferase